MTKIIVFDFKRKKLPIRLSSRVMKKVMIGMASGCSTLVSCLIVSRL